MKDDESVSMQVKLVRQMQAKEGHEMCYATKRIGDCSDRECVWRHDCFDELSENGARPATGATQQ